MNFCRNIWGCLYTCVTKDRVIDFDTYQNSYKLSHLKKHEKLRPIKAKDLNEQINYMKSRKFEVSFDQSIGTGTYGQVYKAYICHWCFPCRCIRKKALIACKTIKVKVIDESSMCMVSSMQNELDVLERHSYQPFLMKNVKNFSFWCSTTGKDNSYMDITVYIFTEYTNGCNLEDELQTSGPFDKVVVQTYFRQIVAGVKCLHRYGIAHRDLKLQNVLFKTRTKWFISSRVCAISDSGLSRIVNKNGVGSGRFDQFISTRPYMAPEVMKLRLYEMKGEPIPSAFKYRPMPVDCWALGVILYRLLTKSFPFYLTDQSPEKVDIIENSVQNMIFKNWTFPETTLLDDSAKDLIYQCFEPDFTKRINITDIELHPWLRREKTEK